MAQAFARFGSEVVLVATEHGILPREDSDASKIVREALERDSVALRGHGRELRVSRADGAKIQLRVESPGNAYEENVDKVLIGTGRAPNVEGLGLEAAGVEFSEKGVKVNDHLQTTNPRIFAAGDICSRYQFTHAADFMARIVIQNALFFGRAKMSSLVIPWCTYTEPEIAHVGASLRDAKETGLEMDTFTQPLSEVDRAILDGETEGFVRVHLRKGTDKIVGATIVAAHAGDMISIVAMAMTHGLGLGKMANTIFPYPTQAEAVRKTGDAYNRTRLTPRVRKLFHWWLSRNR
jgi:pyruvate/2-oxoglutarate dehydrogenase complex dihydrolipoamide dehydrogenase (E3) component